MLLSWERLPHPEAQPRLYARGDKTKQEINLKKHLTTAAALAFAALFLGACDLITSPEDKKDDPVATTATFAAAADADGNGTVSWSPEGTSFAKGTVITVTGTGTGDYALSSWKDASGAVVSTANPYSFTLNADTSLTASFAAGYRVNADIEHASVTLNPPGPVFETGTVVTATITPDSGYAFCGWTAGLAGTSLSASLTVGSADVSLSASIQPRWTALVHVAVDNNIDFQFEPNLGVVSDYLATLESAEAADTFDVMDIFVLLDGYDTSDPRGNSYATPFTDGYYQLTGGAIADDLVKATGEINSGSVAVTKAFMDYAMARSESVRTFYSVFNHGGGFDDANVTATYGIGFDDSNNGDALSHNELAQATAYLKTLTGRNIDVFFPYACLMGGVELAWEVRNSVDVMVASEEVFPAEQWSWEALAEAVANPSIASLALGEAFCDSALGFFTAEAPRTFTLATVDLSKIAPLYDALDAFADAAVAWIGSDSSRAARFDAAASTALFMYTPYYTDLGEYMDRLNADADMGASVKAAIPAVKSALAAAVTSFATADAADGMTPHGEAEGLSIFLATWLQKAYHRDYPVSTYESILAFGSTNGWTDFAAALDDLYVAPAAAAPDAYEPDDNGSTTNVLTVGGASQYHTLHYTDRDLNGDGYLDSDADVMMVALTAGTAYVFETSEGTVFADTAMELHGPDGTYITWNDDIDYDGGDYYSRITYTPTVSGTYYLVVYDRYLSFGDYYVEARVGTAAPAGSQYPKWQPEGIKAFTLTK